MLFCLINALEKKFNNISSPVNNTANPNTTTVQQMDFPLGLAETKIDPHLLD